MHATDIRPLSPSILERPITVRWPIGRGLTDVEFRSDRDQIPTDLESETNLIPAAIATAIAARIAPNSNRIVVEITP